MSQDHVTELLREATVGSPAAAERVYRLVFDELRAIADRHLRKERRDHTLQATELVNEAFLKLIDQDRCAWDSRLHFFAIASQAMRRILVDHARKRGRQRRGGGWEAVPLDNAATVAGTDPDLRIVDLDLALDRLAESQPDKARVVELHIFGGLTHEESARLLGLSPRTISRYWDYAQAWLFREMTGTER